MITFRQLLETAQKYTSAQTSIAQVSGGLKAATGKLGLIKSGDLAVDYGGGKYDLGKNHVESEAGASLHVYDPFNRSGEHNHNVRRGVYGKAQYVGNHNVLNVIQEPEVRQNVIKDTLGFLHKNGVAHFTVYEGDGSGKGKETTKGYQNNMRTPSYMDEVKEALASHQLRDSHEVIRMGSHILVRPK